MPSMDAASDQKIHGLSNQSIVSGLERRDDRQRDEPHGIEIVEPIEKALHAGRGEDRIERRRV